MIHSSNRISQQLVTNGLGSVIQAATEANRRHSQYPKPDESAAASYNCKRGRHSGCFKLTCPCACHQDEAV